MPKKQTESLQSCETALGLISDGLNILESCPDITTSARGIDIIARLNTQFNALKKILEPMKENLKARLIGASPSEDITEKGNLYQVTLKRISKSYLMTDALKKFLGKRYSQFTETRNETQLTFGVKE